MLMKLYFCGIGSDQVITAKIGMYRKKQIKGKGYLVMFVLLLLLCNFIKIFVALRQHT